MLITILLSGLLNGFTAPQAGDSVYYARVTSVRNYLNTDRTMTTEVWNAPGKTCTLTGQRKIITREDLGVIYNVNLQSKTYRLDSIRKASPAPAITQVSKEPDFKHIGQDYSPVFEWKPAEWRSRDTYQQLSCEHFACIGDADFARVSLHYYVTTCDDKNLARMINSVMMNYPGLMHSMEPLIKAAENNRDLIIVKFIDTAENAIASPITTSVTVEYFGKGLAESSIFDPPSDFRKTE